MNETDGRRLENIERDIGSVKTDVAEIKTAMLGIDRKSGFVRQVRDHDDRIRALEDTRTRFMVIISLASAGGAAGLAEALRHLPW